MNSMIFPRIFITFFWDFLYYPYWWYTHGLLKFLQFCKELVIEANISLAPGLWAKNILVPMFGQTDWQGRLMSIFMRVVNILFRSFGLGIFLLVLLVLVLLWLSFLPFVLTMFIFAVSA